MQRRNAGKSNLVKSRSLMKLPSGSEEGKSMSHFYATSKAKSRIGAI
jgi:hypothetical protein